MLPSPVAAWVSVWVWVWVWAWIWVWVWVWACFWTKQTTLQDRQDLRQLPTVVPRPAMIVPGNPQQYRQVRIGAAAARCRCRTSAGDIIVRCIKDITIILGMSIEFLDLCFLHNAIVTQTFAARQSIELITGGSVQDKPQRWRIGCSIPERRL